MASGSRELNIKSRCFSDVSLGKFITLKLIAWWVGGEPPWDKYHVYIYSTVDCLGIEKRVETTDIH